MAEARSILLPDGRLGGTALVDIELLDMADEDGWTLALFNRSEWLGRDEDDEPYLADDGTFLVKWDGRHFTVHQTVATMLEN